MYSRQNRSGQQDIPVELPRDYSGNAFSPFSSHRESAQFPPCEPKRDDECIEKEENKRDECKKEEREKEEVCKPVPVECPSRGALTGLSGLLGGNIGLEELLLLGVIFLIFTDESIRDNELLICLLLILFI